MQNTLAPGDRILINRLAYLGADPEPGDVVVFDAGASWDKSPPESEGFPKSVLRWIAETTGFGPTSQHTLVKRVIAVAGQTVQCCTDQGKVVVNGQTLEEKYIFEDFPFVAGQLDCSTSPRSLRCFAAVKVPDDSMLVLGDHRSSSADSATLCRSITAIDGCWKWAERSRVVGKAAVILWPIDRWGGVS